MMHADTLEKLDAARTLAEDLQAQLEAAKALLQGREVSGGGTTSKALELSSREAYGFGLMLGFLADQMGKLEADLGQTQAEFLGKAV